MIKVYFNGDQFYKILHNSKVSARNLGDPNNKMYIGWTARTITRAVRNGYMSEGLYGAIMRKIDISECVTCTIDDDTNTIFPRLENLERKIEELNNKIDALETKIEILHTL